MLLFIMNSNNISERMIKMKKLFSLMLVLIFIFALTSSSIAADTHPNSHWDCSIGEHNYRVYNVENYYQVSYPGMCSHNRNCIITTYYRTTAYMCAACGHYTTTTIITGENHSNH